MSESPEEYADKFVTLYPTYAVAIARRVLVAPPPQTGLTRRQRDVLDYIRSYLAATPNVPPSFDEIKEALGISSKSGVHHIITALVARGYITRHSGVPRSIALVQP